MKQILHLALGLLLATSALQAHSDAFKPKFVDTLIEPYLTMQQGFAGDNLKAAQSGASAFLEAMKHAPHEGGAHEEAADLSAPAKVIATATDIKAARGAFLDVSREMISLVQHVGTTESTSLYTANCPMAFGGSGGDWIQSTKSVENPYYGSMMFRCGSIKKQIAGTTAASGHEMHKDAAKAESSDHSGHSH
jgi:membrane fusion protein, copper/silver efflux system